MSPGVPLDWSTAYPSRRSPVLADRVVATSHPLAVQAGLQAMAAGGNAVDAAVAAAAMLTVVEPTSNGIGGDAFALVWDGDALHGLAGAGRSPAALEAERLRSLPTMPTLGWDTVTVPGAPSVWAALARRFGRLPLTELLEPAAQAAERGHLVPPVTAGAWARAETAYDGFEDFAAAFLLGGRAPRAGERFALPDQARTLRLLGATDAASLYDGELAERLVAHAAATGGALTSDDLAAHESQWVQPLSVPAGEVELFELPPPTQGLAALSALGLAARLPAAAGDPDDVATVHAQVEATKLALDDAWRHVADLDAMRCTPASLLAPEHLDRRAARVRDDRSAFPAPPSAPGGTVYLATADDEGRMVSFIQSNYMGFGSGIVVPGTGIALQNRGAGFRVHADHPNVVAGGKRPFHTIIPAFATRNGAPWLAFGVMGGHMQAQGHLQVLTRIAWAGQHPQAAIDAPRWRVDEGSSVALEEGHAGLADGLADRGHIVVVGEAAQRVGTFGGAQAIMALDAGGWAAASDPRKDGHAAGW